MPPDSPYASQVSGLGLSNLRQRELMQAVLGRGAQFRFEALGFSMYPFIQHGDTLTIAPLTDPARLRPGVVAAFIQTENETMAVHRLLAVQGDQVLFQGDNNPEGDSPVSLKQILGVVTNIQRDGRRVSLGLGPEGLWIAWLQRRGWLRRLMQAGLFIRRPFSAGLHRLQGSRLYRVWVKRFSPPFRIETATPRDLIELTARVSPNSDARPLKDMPGVTHLVAKQGKRLLGYLALVRFGPQHAPFSGFWGTGLIVWGRYRGAGIAQALTDKGRAIAISEGVKSIRLMVFADNQPALPLYIKLGFQQIEAPELAAVLAESERQTGKKQIVMELDLTKELQKNDG